MNRKEGYIGVVKPRYGIILVLYIPIEKMILLTSLRPFVAAE